MWIELSYGKKKVDFEIEKDQLLKVLTPSEIPPSKSPELEVESSLKNPIEGPTIEELSPKGKTIAIAVDDMTRVTPTHIILPTLLSFLEKSGAKKEDIKIIIALGTHRSMDRKEMKEKYGEEIVERYEVINHEFEDQSELEYLGNIVEDVPVWINKNYLKADIRIATGNLIPHFNAGWGAGAKILLPGLAGEETVGRMHIHSSITNPNALGLIENPTREIIDAFAEKVGIHLLINTAINRNKEIVKVFSGHFKKAHREGVEFAKKIYGVEVPEKADVTISSSHPADIEFWQGQKGIFSADLATKDGGEIILLTPCPEGISVMHPKILDYLENSYKDLKKISRLRDIEDPVGLAISICLAYEREKHPIYIVSECLTNEEVGKMGFIKSGSIEEAMEVITKNQGSNLKYNILTYGGETYPIVK
jgi:nickel-dependent lactate racemase